MKKTNLLIVIGLSLVIGGSALNITANFNNDQIETSKPKRSNENLNKFKLELTKTNSLLNHYNETIQDIGTFYFDNRKEEYSGYNQALQANLELVSQSKSKKLIGSTDNYLTIAENETTPDNTILIKYEITPYKSLYESKTKQTLYTELNTLNTSEEINVIYKITELTTTQDWSKYMGQASWYGKQNNQNIIDEITNPQNEQIYNEKITTQKLQLTNWMYNQISIQSELEIIDNNTTYHFIFIQPYIETTNSNIYNQITTTGCLGRFVDSIPPTIEGYIIPNIENYEVIDLPNLLFTILTMPFAFISQAFNITLFPGTPYQINLSNLFLTILAILIFVFIVKLFVNMKG